MEKGQWWNSKESGIDYLRVSYGSDVATGFLNPITRQYEISVAFDCSVCSGVNVMVSHHNPKVAKLAAARVAGVTLTKEP